MARARGLPTKLLLAAGASVAALLLLELGARGWWALRQGGYSRASAERVLSAKVSPMRERVPRVGADLERRVSEERTIPHPYFGWDQDAANLDWARREAERCRAGRPQDELLIMVVGGSVATGFAGRAGPALQELLCADPRLAGKRVLLANHARGAFKQPQQVMVLGYMLAMGYRPDLVLCLDGFNEVAMAWSNATEGVHPLHPAAFMWAPFGSTLVGDPDMVALAAEVLGHRRDALELERRALDGGWMRSALLGTLALRRAAGLRERWRLAGNRFQEALQAAEDDAPWKGPGFEGDREAALRLAAQSWVDSSLALDGMSRAHGIPFVHALQPTMHDAGSKPLHRGEIATGSIHEPWRLGVLEGYPLLREAGAHLRERGVRFVDLSGAFAEDERPLYLDGCHFRAEGDVRLAELLAPEIVAALFEAPASQR